MEPKELNATYCQIPPGKEKGFQLRVLTVEDCVGMFFIVATGK